MAVHGYVRYLTSDTPEVRGELQHEWAEAVERLFSAAEHARGELFEDEPAEAREVYRRRRGHQLHGRLAKGDVVLMPWSRRSFAGVRDLIVSAARWAERGVELVVLDLGIDTRTEAGRAPLALARQLDVMGRTCKSEANRQRVAKRMSEGKPWGHPPWGCQIRTRGKVRRFEANPEYVEVAKIVKGWRTEGYTWPHVAQGLELRGIRRPVIEGKDKCVKRRVPWTNCCLQKAYPKMLTLLERVERGEVPVSGRRIHGWGSKTDANGRSGSNWKSWA